MFQYLKKMPVKCALVYSVNLFAPLKNVWRMTVVFFYHLQKMSVVIINVKMRKMKEV